MALWAKGFSEIAQRILGLQRIESNIGKTLQKRLLEAFVLLRSTEWDVGTAYWATNNVSAELQHRLSPQSRVGMVWLDTMMEEKADWVDERIRDYNDRNIKELMEESDANIFVAVCFYEELSNLAASKLKNANVQTGLCQVGDSHPESITIPMRRDFDFVDLPKAGVGRPARNRWEDD